MGIISIWHARIPARLRSGGVLPAGAALAVLATGGVAMAGDAVAAGPIRACYQPGTPTAALQVVTRQHASCPKGDKRLTWNIVGPQGPQGPQGLQGEQGPTGPQGPAGLSTGVTTGKVATIPIDTGPSSPVVVLTAPAVPSSGVYYLTASVTIQVAGGDLVPHPATFALLLR